MEKRGLAPAYVTPPASVWEEEKPSPGGKDDAASAPEEKPL